VGQKPILISPASPCPLAGTFIGHQDMTEYDESLEVGIASGLDIPTAMVVSEVENKPPGEPAQKPKAGAIVVIVVILVLAALFLILQQ